MSSKYTKEKITKIRVTEKDDQGHWFKNKNGNIYAKMGIQIESLGDQIWLNGFASPSNSLWKEGDVVTIQVIESTYNGKQKYEFKSLNTFLDSEIFRIKQMLQPKGGANAPRQANTERAKLDREGTVDYGESINPDDIPFR